MHNSDRDYNVSSKTQLSVILMRYSACRRIVNALWKKRSIRWSRRSTLFSCLRQATKLRSIIFAFQVLSSNDNYIPKSSSFELKSEQVFDDVVPIASSAELLCIVSFLLPGNRAYSRKHCRNPLHRPKCIRSPWPLNPTTFFYPVPPLLLPINFPFFPSRQYTSNFIFCFLLQHVPAFAPHGFQNLHLSLAVP